MGAAGPFLRIVQLNLRGPALTAPGSCKGVIGAVYIGVIGQIQVAVAALAGIGPVGLTAQGNHGFFTDTIFIQSAQDRMGFMVVLSGPDQVELIVPQEKPGIKQGLIGFHCDDFTPLTVPDTAKANGPAAVAGFAPGIPYGAPEGNRGGIEHLTGTGNGGDLLQAIFPQHAALQRVVMGGILLIMDTKLGTIHGNTGKLGAGRIDIGDRPSLRRGGNVLRNRTHEKSSYPIS